MAKVHVGLEEIIVYFEDWRIRVVRSISDIRLSRGGLALMPSWPGPMAPRSIAQWAQETKRLSCLRCSICPTAFLVRMSFVACFRCSNRRRFKRALRPGWGRCGRRRPKRARSSSRSLAVDGKDAAAQPRSQTRLGALHSVSVWASEFGLSLGQVALRREIQRNHGDSRVVAPSWTSKAPSSIDAMGTQKAIAAQINRPSGDFLLARSKATKRRCTRGDRLPRPTIRERLFVGIDSAPAHDDRNGSWPPRDAQLRSPARAQGTGERRIRGRD